MSIIRVEKHDYTAEPFYQWDRNQVLTIYGLSLPSTPEVHFYNTAMDRAIVRQATMDSAGVITVSVPNGLLQKPYTITAHLCTYTGATFETQYTLKLPVTPRTQPSDYTLEDDGDVYSFNELNNKVERAVAELREAENRFNSSLEEMTDLVSGKLIDNTLSQAGKAADAKAVGDAIAGLNNTLSGEIASVVSVAVELLASHTLWENPNPSNDFETQTVPLDLSAYKRVTIQYKAQSNSTGPVREITISERDLAYRMNITDGSSNKERDVTVTDEGVKFVVLTYAFNCIPLKIIGHKI